MTPIERFNALPARRRDEILEKHRNWNVEHFDWWDEVYGVFKSDMAEIGIEVDKMYFSGFWSQGDGACFEGSVDNWPKFLASLGYADPALITLADTGWRFHVEHRGHYYHENCTSFSVTLNTLDCHDADDEEDFARHFSPYKSDIQTAAWMALIAEYKREDLEEQFTEEFKRHMRDLYSRLECEYDDMTSDEAVLDSLDANDMLTEIIDELESEYA
jgi:hypothetical protein